MSLEHKHGDRSCHFDKAIGLATTRKSRISNKKKKEKNDIIYFYVHICNSTKGSAIGNASRMREDDVHQLSIESRVQHHRGRTRRKLLSFTELHTEICIVMVKGGIIFETARPDFLSD